MRGLPRLALALIRISIPRTEREWILGDIDEEYARLETSLGTRSARRWLYGETLRTTAGAPRLRAAFAGQPTSPSGDRAMRQLFQDVHYAGRQLRRSPAFALLATLTLSIGIGASTTIFSIVHGVLLEPLPYAEPDRLVRLFDSNDEEPKWPMAPGNFHEYRARAQSLEALAAYERADLQIGGDRPEQLRGMRVTPGFFSALGWRPALGRDFRPEEERPGAGDVAILGHGLWVRRFGSNPSIVGQTVRLSDRPFLIAGILPAGFSHVGGSYRSYPHGETVDIWWVRTIPAVPQPRDRNQHYLNVVARLREGVTIGEAQRELSTIAGQLAREFPQSNSAWGVRVSPLRDEIVGDTEPMLLVLLASVHLVLLLACANVAGLLLGRATGRTREIGVRAALGATRLRLARQLVVESIVLALAAGVLGIALATLVVRILPLLGPEDVPRLTSVTIEMTVVLYGLAATCGTALVFGLAPAIHLVRSSVVETLKHGGRGTTGASAPRLRAGLVAVEVALAFVLLVGAGLLVRSFEKMAATDPGFRPAGVLTARMSLPPTRYPGTDTAATFYSRVRERVLSLPGVTAAGFGSDLPWTGYDENTSFGIIGRTFPPNEGPEARFHMVTTGYFDALGVPLVAGRPFTTSDVASAPAVVLVNETLAKRFWGSAGAAIGAPLNLWGNERRIIGVVGDVRDTPWADAAEAALYFPQPQQYFGQDMMLAVRTDGEPLSLAGAVTSALREIDPSLPLANVATLESVARGALATRRFLLWLVVGFGATAMFLAGVGIYGIAAQSIGLRVQEFGVRQALGATPNDIVRIVLRAAALLGITGIAAGAMMAWASTRLLSSVLYGVDPLDPLTFSAVAMTLLFAAICASYLPARRATRFDPASVLRGE